MKGKVTTTSNERGTQEPLLLSFSQLALPANLPTQALSVGQEEEWGETLATSYNPSNGPCHGAGYARQVFW